MPTKELESPLILALSSHKVKATVTDLDHVKSFGGVTVETDYIITVQPSSEDGAFEEFSISKTYSAFRSLAHELQKCVHNFHSLPPEMAPVAKFCELVSCLVDSQQTQYLGKVNLPYLKSTTTERERILNEVLEVTCQQFPDAALSHSLSKQVAHAVEMFFLTDHVNTSQQVPSIKRSSSMDSADTTTKKRWFKKPSDGIKKLIKPISSKVRPSKNNQNVVALSETPTRGEDEKLAQVSSPRASLITRGASQSSNTSGAVSFVLNPVVLFGAAVAALIALHYGSLRTVTLDADIAFLVVFASFCLGWNLPRRSTASAIAPRDPAARQLLRRSILGPSSTGSLVSEEEAPMVLDSPLPMFPEGAPIGSHNNCWSNPDHKTFKVRGPKYLTDRKKVPSGDFLFPCRGIDLFLTDSCPENVGQNPNIMGKKLRDKPTFIINFRLPWGVLLFYFEIPEKFLPFLRACYEKDFEQTLPSLDAMSPAERAVCRFLLGDQDHKNGTLKIVPVVVDGPWIVKSVVGGKPAIIGTKLPTNYVYEPAKGKKCCYLEADLDIAASSAARSILSVTRSYTQVLTMDLGFVVQGNTSDELSEQMLVGSRLHGVDPLNCPAYPLTQEDAMKRLESRDDDNE